MEGQGMVRLTRALISVSDKTGLLDLGKFLAGLNVHILSTGGTAKALRDAGIDVQDVGDYTGFPEIMDGRVKTLHPKIHGGLLGVRDNAEHQQAFAAHNISEIDLVVCNLYPFEATVAKTTDFATCIENIDIGGPSMIRSSAKNHKFVTVVTDAQQYGRLMEELKAHNGHTSHAMRRDFACAAFARTAAYDSAISAWFANQEGIAAPNTVTRTYTKTLPLKYGNNPHQAPAGVLSLAGHSLPFKVVNGAPGYINLLDAVNAWQLVRELRAATNLPAAASFKHVSPAGAAVAAPLPAHLAEVYEVQDKQLSPLCVAYLRARQADPKCSFGDFVAVSDIVDMSTAELLKTEVSDGIIAPGFEPGALEILTSKKQGKYIVIQADPDFKLPDIEFRELHGAVFSQKRNDAVIDASTLANVVTNVKDLSPEAIRDLIVAQITVKYTQSNSVGYSLDGQMIGVGAGQQSRVDCVKLAGKKAEVWYLRQHPKVRALRFKSGVKRVERTNARVAYIEGDFTSQERTQWEQLFEQVPEDLTESDRVEFLKTLQGVSISSDAFFPFRDNIDQASKRGVKYIVQPGGSVQDQEVISAANEYSMAMCFSGMRLFHH